MTVTEIKAPAAEITRQFTPDLEVRSDSEGRTITGIVVPFERAARVSDGGPSYDEMFRAGAFAKTIQERGDRVKLLSQHQAGRNPLGRATMLREDGSGLYGEFRVSRTQAGDEALELVRDGALDSFSVGFSPVKHVKEGKTVVRTEVALREASLVTFPAYQDARIAAVRTTLEALEAMTSEERAELVAHLSRDLSTTPDEPVDGTSSEAAKQIEPVIDHSARNKIIWANFKAALIQKGIN
jgi:HK97 family phage prohead protease